MPFAMLLIGALLIVAGIRNQLSPLGALLAKDFSGKGNFLYWIAGIGAVGAIGEYAPMKNASRLFLVLIILSMVIADKGFFAQLQSALADITTPAPASEASVGAATPDAGTLAGSNTSVTNSLAGGGEIAAGAATGNPLLVAKGLMATFGISL